MSELRIRVKPIIKNKLEELKKKTGLGMNHIVNWALVKFMITEKLITIFEYDNEGKIDPHYEYENKLPEDIKYCDGDSCNR